MGFSGVKSCADDSPYNLLYVEWVISEKCFLWSVLHLIHQPPLVSGSKHYVCSISHPLSHWTVNL